MYDFVTGFFYLAIFLIFFLLVSINTSFLFTNEYYSIVHIYHNSFPRLFIHIAFFPPFGCCEYCYWEYYCTCFLGGISSFWLFYVSTRRGTAGPFGNFIFNLLGSCQVVQIVFHGAAWFHIPISTVDDSNFSMFLPTLIILHFLKVSSCGDRCRNISHCHFDLYFPHD